MLARSRTRKTHNRDLNGDCFAVSEGEDTFMWFSETVGLASGMLSELRGEQDVVPGAMMPTYNTDEHSLDDMSTTIEARYAHDVSAEEDVLLDYLCGQIADMRDNLRTVRNQLGSTRPELTITLNEIIGDDHVKNRQANRKESTNDN